MEIKNQIKLEIYSKSENVALARVTIASFASQLDFTLSELDEIKVATSEAVSNSIIHGYKERPGIVTILGTLYKDRIEIIVQDNGTGISDVPQAKEPSFTTEPGRMGLGFSFIDSFMDAVDIQSELGKGTQIRMVKYFQKNNTQDN